MPTSAATRSARTKRAIVALAVLCIGCGNEPSSDLARSPLEETAAPSSAAFSASIAEEPCAVLTAVLVSNTVGIPAVQLEQREVAGTCSYSWDGGTVALLRLDVFESAGKAAGHFSRTYRETTAEEQDEADAAMHEGLAEHREAGEFTAGEAEGLAGVVGEAAASTRYEPVGGIGDQAVYDGTVRTKDLPLLGPMTTAESKLHFRVENLVTGVTVDLFQVSNDPAALRAGPPPEVRRRNREATTALAQTVVDALR